MLYVQLLQSIQLDWNHVYINRVVLIVGHVLHTHAGEWLPTCTKPFH